MHPCPKRKRIKLKGKAKTEFRKQVFEKYSGTCQSCGRFAPLYDRDGVFDVFLCGHVSHIKSTGSGGEDIFSNVKWECYNCHINGKHGLKWSNRGGR